MKVVKPNGLEHSHVPDPASDTLYSDLQEEQMAGTTRANNDERIADILEGQHTLTLEIRATNLAAQQQATAINRFVDQLGNNKDKTPLPNWLMPIICTAFIGLVVWAFTTVIQNLSRDNEKLERRIELQETYTKNTREQLIAHGWTVDDKGNVLAPPKK